MSKLNVKIDYIKIAQCLEVIDQYTKKIKEELDRAAAENGDPSDN